MTNANKLSDGLINIPENISDYRSITKILEETAGDSTAFFDVLNTKIRNYDLLSDALGATSKNNQHVQQFSNLIDNDFTHFCDIEGALNDVLPTRRLLRIRDDLQRIADFPSLYSRRVGAIGGGFSAGKTAFINSFMCGPGMRLAEGRTPVTAIPCYIIGNASNTSSLVQGVSYRGGIFTIDEEIYSNLSHETLKSFNFNLHEIIRDIVVLTPMPDELFSNLCIMDTPGYNPAKVNTRKEDSNIAKEAIMKADFLIWLVGLDAHGTLPKTDMDFLADMDFGKRDGKKLYIVANKAELQPREDIEDILDEIEDILDEYDLEYEGITAYSSKIKPYIISYRKKDINQFFKENNNKNDIYNSIKKELYNIFSYYIEGILQSCETQENMLKKVKTLNFDLFENPSFCIEYDSRIDEKLRDLIAYFRQPESKEERLQRTRDLRDSFIQCLGQFCESLSIAHERKIFCMNCGMQLKGTRKCPRCSFVN